MKLMDRNGQIMEEPFGSEKKQWRRMTQRRSEIIQDISLCLCLCYVESFAAMQFSTVDLVL